MKRSALEYHRLLSAVFMSFLDRMVIYGRFDALKSGVILADVPGHGDSNLVRSNIAEEAIKKADAVLIGLLLMIPFYVTQAYRVAY